MAFLRGICWEEEEVGWSCCDERDEMGFERDHEILTMGIGRDRSPSQV